MNNALLQNDLEESREVFSINDLQGATWAFRKLRAIEEKQKEITAIAIEEKLRIDEWLSNESKSLNDDKAYFEKKEGSTLIPPRVNMKVDKLLRDFILSACILRRDKKKHFYYQAELQDTVCKRSVMIVPLEKVLSRDEV